MSCAWKREYEEAVAYLERLEVAYKPRFARLNAMQSSVDDLFRAECAQEKRAKRCLRSEGGCLAATNGGTKLWEPECTACKWIPTIRRIMKLRTLMSGRILEATMKKRHLYWYPPEGWVPEDDTGAEPDEHLTWIAEEINN